MSSKQCCLIGSLKAYSVKLESKIVTPLPLTEMVYIDLAVIYSSIYLPKAPQSQRSRAIRLTITYKHTVGFHLLGMLQYRLRWWQQVDALRLRPNEVGQGPVRLWAKQCKHKTLNWGLRVFEQSSWREISQLPTRVRGSSV